MKMIFWTLLLLNFIFFGYHYLELSGESQGVLKPGARLKQISSSGVQAIYLLNENSNSEIREQELEFIIKNPLRSETGAQSKMCLGIGPFADLFAGQSVAEQLKALDLNVELKAIDQLVGQSDYRIMIPPASTLQDAFRKLRELKSQNIDSYVITQGKDSLGISLGVYSRELAAINAKEKLEAEGYKSVMVEIPRLIREFWILNAGQSDLNLPLEVWQRMLNEYPKLEQKQLPCLNSGQIDGDL
ncbi:MAG: hypothetical protein ACJAVI_004356 [Candidatus Azotimanducaceae bacterium]|jgi:hypothetical protein